MISGVDAQIINTHFDVKSLLVIVQFEDMNRCPQDGIADKHIFSCDPVIGFLFVQDSAETINARTVESIHVAFSRIGIASLVSATIDSISLYYILIWHSKFLFCFA